MNMGDCLNQQSSTVEKPMRPVNDLTLLHLAHFVGEEPSTGSKLTDSIGEWVSWDPKTKAFVKPMDRAEESEHLQRISRPRVFRPEMSNTFGRPVLDCLHAMRWCSQELKGVFARGMIWLLLKEGREVQPQDSPTTKTQSNLVDKSKYGPSQPRARSAQGGSSAIRCSRKTVSSPCSPRCCRATQAREAEARGREVTNDTRRPKLVD